MAEVEIYQNGFNFSSNNYEPNFDDPEGFVDDITDEELLGDILKQRPTDETDSFENVIIIDGIPKVAPDRHDKLKSVIKKLFGQIGNINNEPYFPTDENNFTKGYIFLEYTSHEQAQEAVKTINNYRLDKSHTLQVNLFTDFDKYENIPAEWNPPEPQPYRGQSDIHYHLLEADAFDQFCVLIGQGNSVQIWRNTLPEPQIVEERSNWTQTYVKWSPLGTFLCTFFKMGVALWGGPKFRKYQKYAHNDVQLSDFSPTEKYLVTYCPIADFNNPEHQKLIVWDVRTGLEKRSFNPQSPQCWPILRWSFDDKYFALLSKAALSVYETPSFGLLDKKSIKISGIRNFGWSPTDSVIAYWVAEDKDVPARVTLLEIPSRTESRNKNLFNVMDCKIYWQKSGNYLCVKVDRYSKFRKENGETKYFGIYFNFEIFHMREKLIPVDSIEIKESAILAFAWEPVGTNFAIIHGETTNISVSFYEVRMGQAPLLLKRLENKACNHLSWSPNGQFVVLVGLGIDGGSLEFIDTHEFSILSRRSHFQVSDVEWDPTGRYVVTEVSSWKAKVDTGYWIWTFQGKILKRVNLDKFSQFLWRPRCPTLLDENHIKKIKKNLKKYYAEFENKDRKRLTKASKDVIEKRSVLMEKFTAYRHSRIKEWNAQKFRRMELRNGIDTDELDSDTKNLKEETVEFFVKEVVIIIE